MVQTDCPQLTVYSGRKMKIARASEKGLESAGR